MRKIKFRGKDNQGRWWKGDLRHTMMELGNPHCRIVNVDKDDYDRLKEKWSDPIQEDTIGQFTGMFCEDKEIYEGDIIHCAIGHSPNIFEITGVVEYHTCAFVMHYKHHNQDAYTWLDAFFGADIIGNIHDNPELMEGGEG